MNLTDGPYCDYCGHHKAAHLDDTGCSSGYLSSIGEGERCDCGRFMPEPDEDWADHIPAVPGNWR